MKQNYSLVDLPRLHITPLALVSVNSPNIILEADDGDEKRIRIVFSPYQAIRMVSIDCFSFSDSMPNFSQSIIEIKDSKWISSLQKISKESDCDADFMTKSKHFLVPLQDDVLEIIAWNFTYELIKK